VRRALGVRLGHFYHYPPRPLCVSCVNAGHEGQGDLPRISLVTPSLNQSRFIRETIESVLGQNYAKLDYRVQDAGSTDGTAQILETFAGRALSIRVETDDGQADALNRGFAGSTGEVMGYLNSDDLLLPGTLQAVGLFFRDNPTVDVIYGNRLIIDQDGREVGRWILPGHNLQVLQFVDYIPQESMFWRRRIWTRVGGKFAADLHYALDWDLALRFATAGAEFKHLPELIGVFRVHKAQKSQIRFVARGAGEMASLRERHGGSTMSAMRRALLHWRYLSAHRRADAVFEASLKRPTTSW
jgi:glycosyltransferase involved in cell wall biosynthesis